MVIKRALISLSNKEGLIPFALALHAMGIEILSTGGTYSELQKANIPATSVSDFTQFPEMMDGRVKTLHPKIHAGILGKRLEHQAMAELHQIAWIDLVVVNLYPFASTIQKPDVTFEEAIENIDIGGPTMIRAAAKNCAYVTVVVDPTDYKEVIFAIETQGMVPQSQRIHLAEKAFQHTALYDAGIHQYFASLNKSNFNETVHLKLTQKSNLRYGENPHQEASAYILDNSEEGVLNAQIHQGKPLSYNNLLDADAAFTLVAEFEEPACVIVKHTNPCGVGIAENIEMAFSKALKADDVAAFGGIIALNRTCNEEVAKAITASFFEVLIAPEYTKEALLTLASKPNLRVLELPVFTLKDKISYQSIQGGLLMQKTPFEEMNTETLEIVTEKAPSKEMLNALLFAWKVVKHVKSNAIVLANATETLSIGPGQVSRIDAVEIALKKAKSDTKLAVLASDAFFPFRDCIDAIAKAGIEAIIQPGGSRQDQLVIDACNEHGISMVFTGVRCFKH